MTARFDLPPGPGAGDRTAPGRRDARLWRPDRGHRRGAATRSTSSSSPRAVPRIPDLPVLEPHAAAPTRREAEAAEALRRLGAGDEPRTFLRLPDAAMPVPGEPAHCQAQADARPASSTACRPALVVLPWRRDPHCDHRASWALATAALAASGQSPAVLEYAIWLDELGAPGDYPAPGEAEAVVLAVPAGGQAPRARSPIGPQLGVGVVRRSRRLRARRPRRSTRLTGPEEIYWRPCAAR